MFYVHKHPDPTGLGCSYCGRPLGPVGAQDGLSATVDHVWPLRERLKNSSRKRLRTVWACRACNEIKADMLPQNWRVFMAAHPKWWEVWGAKVFSPRHQLELQARHCRFVQKGK